LIAHLQTMIVSSEEGPAFWFLNTLSTIKATTESTGGSYSLVHHITPPGFATPYHLHHAEDEAFYVLDGAVTFFSDGKKISLGPGGYIFLPRGIPHGLRIDGSAPATMLILAMPGDGFVGMMQEMGEPANARILPKPTEPDMKKLVALCTRYGIDVLGPLPG
jgi:quercetin dioxygenase-like cupin family protein